MRKFKLEILPVVAIAAIASANCGAVEYSQSGTAGGAVRAMDGVKLLSLKFWDEGYFAPGESKEFAEGFRGGPGWLMSCPAEDPKVKLPRILCYGDSILNGYGPRLDLACGDGYHWHGAGYDLIVEKIIETIAPELGIKQTSRSKAF